MTADSLHQRSTQVPGHPTTVQHITDGIVLSCAKGCLTGSLDGFAPQCRVCDYVGPPQMLLALARDVMVSHLIDEHQIDPAEMDCDEIDH